MKLLIFSDLHIQHSLNPVHIQRGADVLINAGDTGGPIDYYAPHIEALGNHDFYNHSFPLPGENQKYLLVDDVHFAAATLWTQLSRDQFNIVRDELNDSRYIFNYNYEALQEAHLSDWEFLKSSGADVIVTHHSPFWESVAPRYRNDPVTAGFHSNLSSAIMSWPKPPKLWIHGHTHIPCDYMLNGMRVICHPRGYPGEVNHRNYKPMWLNWRTQ